MSRPAPHPFTADGAGDCARCPLPQANAVHVTEHQAAEQVRALLPIAAPVLGLRWWGGEWWSEQQWNDHVVARTIAHDDLTSPAWDALSSACPTARHGQSL